MRSFSALALIATVGFSTLTSAAPAITGTAVDVDARATCDGNGTCFMDKLHQTLQNQTANLKQTKVINSDTAQGAAAVLNTVIRTINAATVSVKQDANRLGTSQRLEFVGPCRPLLNPLISELLSELSGLINAVLCIVVGLVNNLLGSLLGGLLGGGLLGGLLNTILSLVGGLLCTLLPPVFSILNGLLSSSTLGLFANTPGSGAVGSRSSTWSLVFWVLWVGNETFSVFRPSRRRSRRGLLREDKYISGQFQASAYKYLVPLTLAKVTSLLLNAVHDEDWEAAVELMDNLALPVLQKLQICSTETDNVDKRLPILSLVQRSRCSLTFLDLDSNILITSDALLELLRSSPALETIDIVGEDCFTDHEVLQARNFHREGSDKALARYMIESRWILGNKGYAHSQILGDPIAGARLEKVGCELGLDEPGESRNRDWAEVIEAFAVAWRSCFWLLGPGKSVEPDVKFSSPSPGSIGRRKKKG
ncbi:hypothetical protein C8J56DRAFT_883632 [Mycena floridula]|nr:hypothetical protein C8J56DRAFT_883632 [Mycena floridula]